MTPSQTIDKITEVYVTKLEESIAEHETLLNQAQEQGDKDLLNIMFGQLLDFNDRAIQSIMQAAERIKARDGQT